jgi:hypothetical protein
MNKIWLSFLAVAALLWSAWGQKVEVQKPDRGQILHVSNRVESPYRSARLRLVVPYFKVEWRENKVFIQPTEPNVATNLCVSRVDIGRTS